MKIRVEQDELKRAVGWAARTLSARPSSTLHAGIRLEAGTDSILVTTFDNETATRADVAAVIDEPGVAMVPGRLLAEIAKELPRQPVELTLDGSLLSIACGRTRFRLPTYPLDQLARLPEMPRFRGEADASLFAESVAQVQIAASRDDLLPPLTGIRVELGETHLTLVATDRYRLAIRELQWRPAGGGDRQVLVKARQLADLAHSMESDAAVRIGLADDEEGPVGFSVAGRELVTRVMGGDFPSYRALLPDSAETSVTVAAEELISAVKRVKIVTSERNTPIKLAFSDGEVRLMGANTVDDSRADESMECSIEGSGLEIAFNPDLLMEGLQATRCDTVELAFNGPSKAAIIRPQEHTGYRYLLMPMRLN